MGDPRGHGRAGLLSDLELDRSTSLLLHDHSPTGHAFPVCDVSDAQPHQFTGPELAVDGDVKQRKLAGSLRELQTDTDGPDVFEAQRGLLSDKLALIPGFAGRDNLKMTALPNGVTPKCVPTFCLYHSVIYYSRAACIQDQNLQALEPQGRHQRCHVV